MAGPNKRPLPDSAGGSGEIYPQRPGEKMCAYYMTTRSCSFGVTCRFDHPAWVPVGGIPSWKEVEYLPSVHFCDVRSHWQPGVLLYNCKVWWPSMWHLVGASVSSSLRRMNPFTPSKGSDSYLEPQPGNTIQEIWSTWNELHAVWIMNSISLSWRWIQWGRLKYMSSPKYGSI